MTNHVAPTGEAAPHWKVWLRALALVAALVFLALLLSSQWQALQAYRWQVRAPWLFASVVILAASGLWELSTWRRILAGLGGRLRWLRAAQTWFLSNIVRYIPGNVWQFLGMAELAADDGVPRVSVFTSIALHQALSTGVGLLLAALYLVIAGQGPVLDMLRPALLLAPLGLLLCHPRVLQALLGWLMRRLNRPAPVITLTLPQIAGLLWSYGIAWLLAGAAFASLVAAVTPISREQFVALIAIWAAAYVLGYLSLLTPSGLGVREGVLVMLLTPLFPAPLPVILALAARVWTVATEALLALAALTTRMRTPTPARPAAARRADPLEDAAP